MILGNVGDRPHPLTPGTGASGSPPHPAPHASCMERGNHAIIPDFALIHAVFGEICPERGWLKAELLLD